MALLKSQPMLQQCLTGDLILPLCHKNRPPLAIAMTATVDGIRGLRRYRLVIAQKAKLRLSPGSRHSTRIEDC